MLFKERKKNSDAIHILEIKEPFKFKKLQKIHRTILLKTEPIKEQQKNAKKKEKKIRQFRKRDY